MSTLIKSCRATFTSDKANTKQFTTKTYGGEIFCPEIAYAIAYVNSMNPKLDVYIPQRDTADIILKLVEVPHFISSTFDGRTSISLTLILGRMDDNYLFVTVPRIGLISKNINNNVVELQVFKEPPSATVLYVGDIDKLTEVLSSIT